MSRFGRLDISLLDHPKVVRLMLALNLTDYDTALGIVSRMILRGCCRATGDGLLRDESVETFEHFMRRPGITAVLIDLDLMSCSPSGELTIERWPLYSGAGLEQADAKREADRKRKAEQRRLEAEQKRAAAMSAECPLPVTATSARREEGDKTMKGEGAPAFETDTKIETRPAKKKPARPPNGEFWDKDRDAAVQRAWDAWRKQRPARAQHPEEPPERARRAVISALSRGLCIDDIVLAVSAAAVDPHWCGTKSPHHYADRGGPPDPFQGFPASLSATQAERYIADGRALAEASQRRESERRAVHASLSPPLEGEFVTVDQMRELARSIRTSVMDDFGVHAA